MNRDWWSRASHCSAPRLRAARDGEPALRQQLAAESRAVFAPLANRLGIWQLKWELEDLSFRWLEPDAYREIAAALAEKRSDRERWVVDFVARVSDELRKAGLQAEVYGRPKHIYSIWRKMQRKQLALAQLFDLRAIRIVCANVPDCYAALGVVHSLWTYIPGRVRRLHRHAQGQLLPLHPHGRDRARANCLWKCRSAPATCTNMPSSESPPTGVTRKAALAIPGYERKIEWVRRLLDVGDSQGGDQDFIERVRGELFEDRIYALTPRGEVVDLPRDATPLDFAYHVHTGLGHRCRGAKVNGPHRAADPAPG